MFLTCTVYQRGGDKKVTIAQLLQVRSNLEFPATVCRLLVVANPLFNTVNYAPFH
jgi:hypothetical protein